MFTTGSKFLIGSAVVATVAAIAYGVTQDGVMGTIGLVSAAIALSFLAGVNVFIRDSNVSAMDEAAIATSPAAQAPAGASMWPIGMALGGVGIVLGLVTQQSIFTIGVILVLASGAEWMVQAWSERASVDPSYNSEVRSRLSNPLEFPVLGAAGIGIIVYSFSRVMLWLSKTNTVIAFAVLAAIVLFSGFVFALRPSIKSGAIGGAIALAATAVVATGVAAGVDGQRDIHVFETTTALAEEGICESTEEFEADEDASHTVAAKSNVAVEIVLTSEGRLQFDVPGPFESGATAVTFPRSNPTNVIFRNESDHHRRLSLDLGERLEEGPDGETEAVPHLVCTSLIDEGGAQLLTFTINEPSIAHDGGYRFFVPGVESAVLDVVVP